MYIPEGAEVFGADPRDELDRHIGWIKTDGLDIHSVPPVTILYWLGGTTIAEPTDPRGAGRERFAITIDRGESGRRAPKEARAGVLQSWMQYDRLGAISGMAGTVDISSAGTIKSVDLTVDDHVIAAQYDQVGEQFSLPLPVEVTQIELFSFLQNLGIPDLMPPRLPET